MGSTRRAQAHPVDPFHPNHRAFGYPSRNAMSIELKVKGSPAPAGGQGRRRLRLTVAVRSSRP
jgi:hypothetical protein